VDLKGSLFIITGPSGTGKSALCKELIGRISNLRFSISHTTRAPRGRERDGVHYHYTDKATFEQMIEQGRFAEWTQIHRNYYGTSHDEILQASESGQDLILEIEGDGATQILKQYSNAVSIFVLPPSFDELRRRIEGRGEDAQDEIDRRMANAAAEMKFIEDFEFVVVNDDFNVAVDDLEHIVKAARQRRAFVWPGLVDRFTV